MAQRIQKLLAAAGAGSRRQVEELIKSKAVTVNGKICKLGDKAEPEDKIAIFGKPAGCRANPENKVVAYHKPVGRVVSRSGSEKFPTVFQDLPLLKKSRWIAVGRLDVNTSGLMIFCSDGSAAHKLAHPSSGVEREYMARVRGNTTDETIQKLLTGIRIAGKIGRFEKITPVASPGKNKSNKWFRVTAAEGRNRFVRKMWQSRRCQVSRLIRIRFGSVKLPKNLPPGAFFFLDEAEKKRLYKIAGI